MRNDRNRQSVNTAGRDYYIDGNIVRRMETAPSYREVERIRRERIEREREAELRRQRRAARRKQEKVLRMSRSYVAFLTMVVVAFGTFAGMYISIQSDITSRMKAISSLESQINDVKADNDEAYKRINTAVDLDAIRDTAMNELGMTYAKESQIIYYSVGDDDYMNQYGEIPEK